MALENLQHATYEMLFDRTRRTQFFEGTYDLGAAHGLTEAEVQQIRNTGFTSFSRHGNDRVRRMPQAFPVAARIMAHYFNDPIEIKFLFGESEIFKRHVNDCDTRFEDIYFRFLLQAADDHRQFDFPAFKQILRFEHAKWRLESAKLDESRMTGERTQQEIAEYPQGQRWLLSDRAVLFESDVDVVDILSHMMNYVNEADAPHVTGMWLKKRQQQGEMHQPLYLVLRRDAKKQIRQFRIGQSEFTVLQSIGTAARTIAEVAEETGLPLERVTEIAAAFLRAEIIRDEAERLV
ncbi:MAG: hypothetical protein WCC10_12335 [Tumebacillaceae bacterium]